MTHHLKGTLSTCEAILRFTPLGKIVNPRPLLPFPCRFVLNILLDPASVENISLWGSLLPLIKLYNLSLLYNYSTFFALNPFFIFLISIPYTIIFSSFPFYFVLFFPSILYWLPPHHYSNTLYFAFLLHSILVCSPHRSISIQMTV